MCSIALTPPTTLERKAGNMSRLATQHLVLCVVPRIVDMEIHAMFIHFILCLEACYGLLNLMLLCLLLVYCLKGIRNTYVKETLDNSCCQIQCSIRTSGFTGRIRPGCFMDPKVLELFRWTGARRFGHNFLAPKIIFHTFAT